MKAFLFTVGLLVLLGCSDNSQRYHNARFDFSLQLPSDMQWREDYLGSALVIEPRADSALAGKLRYLSVDVNDAKATTNSLEDYSQFRLSELQRFARRSEIHQRETRSLAGYPAQRLQASVQFGAQENTLLLYYLLADGRGYTLTAAFAPNSGQDSTAQVDALIGSLRLPTP
jgi:hypothetical protein